MISVGGFEYDDDEGEDFIGLFCTICDKEMGGVILCLSVSIQSVGK